MGTDGNAAGKKTLFPAAQIGAHDIFDVVLINAGNAVQKGAECVFIRKKMDDIGLVGSGYL